MFGLELFGGRTDCDDTYSYNDTCVIAPCGVPGRAEMLCMSDAKDC